jgi:MFS family permease
VVTYVVSLLLLVRIAHVTTPAADAVAGLRAIGEGLAYAWRRKDLLGTYTVDVMAMVFGMSTAIFPFVAVTLDAPWAVGLLFAAPAVGSLLVSLTSGWTFRVHRHGLAIAGAAATYGLMMAVVGLAPSIWVALAALAAAGAADMVSGIFRDAVLKTTTPDEMRGRLEGVSLSVVAAGPSLGDLKAGALASVTSVPFSIVSGGLACIVGVGVLAVAIPQLARYDTEVALREAAARSPVRGGPPPAADATPATDEA